MLYFLIASLVIVSFILTYVVRHLAIKKAIMDIPNDRSSHTVPTPRGGGLAVAISWYLGLIVFGYLGQIESKLFYAFLCGLPLSVIGFLDDVFNLSAKIRSLIQALCAALALYFLGGVQTLNVVGFNFDYPFLFSILAFVAIIWFINLFNFLDGIDGHIGLESIFLGLACFVLTKSVVGLILAASVLGFLFWNWQKAKIFMGDVGSTLIGFIVAVLAIYQHNSGEMSIWAWLILSAVFWFDATLTLVRRLKNKENLSTAHRKHAYQRIVQAGKSHQATVLAAFVINLLAFVLILYFSPVNSYLPIVLLCFSIVLFGVVRWIDSKRPFDYTAK